MKTRRKKSSSKRRLPLLDIILMLTMAAFLIFGGIVGSLVYSAVKDLPALSNLEPTVSQTSFVYDRNGNIWHELRSEEYRIPVEFQDIPTHVRYAVLAAEDHRFYSHYGFDLRGIFRALYKNIVEGGLQGGSTITQQLAKEAFLEPARVWKRKVQDAIVAVLLEQNILKMKFYACI